MRYQYLLCDNDNTLMDFDAAEHKALGEALTLHHLPWSEEIAATYHAINRAQWEALERGETTQSKLKVERFRLLCEKLGHADTDSTTLAADYEQLLGTHADLLPGCMEFLQAIKPHMKIALVSNGISATQRGRLSRCPFTDMMDAIVISGEIGISKPDPRIVQYALNAIGCDDPAAAVLLGDSATADIAAANAAGIDSIHLDLRGKPCANATYVVHDLAQACDLLLGK